MSLLLPSRTAASRVLYSARTMPVANAGGGLAAAAARRGFSATGARGSKLGRTPLSVPPGVEISVGERWVKKDLTSYVVNWRKTVTVQGPLGTIKYDIPDFVTVDIDDVERKAVLSVEDSSIKQQREMWGTTWAYINRHITGVSEGHTAVLRLVGIGYRAAVADTGPHPPTYPGQKFLTMKLGYTHTVDLGVPEGVTASTPNPTRILLEGINREEVMSFAGKIREWRKPEPYKGKGVFINDETIKLKQKKIK